MQKKIITKENLHETAKELKKKKFKPGFDGMSMDGAMSWILINGERLCKDIDSGDYTPMPAVGFRTAKIGGGFRELARISALDTVIQNVLIRELSPRLEEIFLDSSMAYRPGKGLHQALELYVAYANRLKFAAKIDILSCFSNMDHSIMKRQLDTLLEDPLSVDLVMRFVTMPICIDQEISHPTKGILQGMPLAPLLCNIYLHAADMFLRASGIRFIRYADDIVIFSDSLSEIQAAAHQLIAYLEHELLLRCNTKKLTVGPSVGMTYLGYQFTVDKKGIIAYEADREPKAAYYQWHNTQPQNSRGSVNILSDGILRQKAFSLYFDTETADTEIPVMATDTINIYSNVIFDSGFLDLTMKNDITVNIFDSQNNCIGSFIPQKPLKSPKTTHDQLTTYYHEDERLALAKEFVLASIHNTLLNIRYHEKQEGREEYREALTRLLALKKKIKGISDHTSLLLHEAQVRQVYYQCFDSFIKQDGFSFEARSKRPPKTNVNALISFGNSVLYSLIATEIQKTPLDVRIGFLHATNSHAASLNLDIAEIFKPLLVDRVIFSLINKGVIQKKHFTRCENDAVYLTNDGKRLFLSAFYQKLDTVITVKEDKLSYDSIIKEEIRKLVRHFKGKEKYKGFRQVR